MNILIYGMQRSGTNFLKKLLLTNFSNINIANGDVRSHPSHKHYRFNCNVNILPDEKYSPSIIINDIEHLLSVIPSIDLIIVIQKNPYDWYDSIKRWAKTCKWKFSNKKFSNEYIEEYKLFYSFWEGVSHEKVIKINYEDLLYDAENFLKSLEDKKLSLKSKKINFENITLSSNDTKFYREKYKNQNNIYKEKIDSILYEK